MKWSSHEVLAGVSEFDITASTELRQKVHHDLWGDMCAEHDADNLWNFLYSQTYCYSVDFQSALNEWLADERNHYAGLRTICSMMYGISEPEIDRQMKARVPDFSRIAHFLTDEFRLCVALAYDELVSSLGYKIFLPDFRQFGPPSFAQWLQRAARDERLHYWNFLDVIKLNHGSAKQVSAVIAEILDYECQPDMHYGATFLLDHTEETFTPIFLRQCGNQVEDDFRKLCSS